MVTQIACPALNDVTTDKIVWRNRDGKDLKFSVNIAYADMSIQTCLLLKINIENGGIVQLIDVVCAAKNQKTSIISCFNVLSQEIFVGKSVIRRMDFSACVYNIWQERNSRIFKDAKRSGEEVFKCIVEVIKHKLLGITVKDSKAVLCHDSHQNDSMQTIHWKAPHILEFNWRSDSVKCWLYYGGVCSQNSDAFSSVVVDPFNEAAAIEWCYNLMFRKCSYSDLDFPNKLKIEQPADLETNVTRDEIKKAAWDCGIDKSLGPDGFTFGFFRRYWSLIEKDVVEAVFYYFQYGTYPEGGSSSFIALIPKTHDVNMVKDFRPITLIGSLYKIIAKILANRLVTVLGDIVNEVQSAFVANRRILDGPFILNELLHWCKNKKKKSMVFKVGFEKAYDSVRWDYLDDVLKKFGFGDRWCGWILSCLRSARGSVIVNGSPTCEFQFYKGLKQGDPLSSFLFILIMESLHISVQRVVDAGMFRGISMGPSLQLSHLFYADDAVFMGHWSDSNIDTIVQMLECFYRASGLRINMNKSKIIGIVVDDNRVEQAATKIGCATLEVPFSFLGSKNLFVGRFFNGVDINGRKPIWIKWSKVLAPKEKGGLGVSNFYSLNKALMFKWVWRFRTQSSSLWVRVIKGIHGEDVSIGKNSKHHHTSIWLDIVREVELLKRQGIDLIDFIRKKMSNGAETYFWEDVWRGDVAFKSLSPESMPWNPFQFLELLGNIEGISLADSRDRWSWSLEGSGEFSVASVRRLIDENILSEVSTKTRWINVVPIKINIHAWKVKLDCLPTKLNISKREKFFIRLLVGGMLLMWKCRLMRSG
ncbi:RNA-directed DNA polymerase, eukaryota, reverse transcriptase zinc-binding domain protein [Tanacetum coccineum]